MTPPSTTPPMQPTPPAAGANSLANNATGSPTNQPWHKAYVPYKTIVATIALVAFAYIVYVLLTTLWGTIQLVLISAFLALVLNPAVEFVEHYAHVGRGVATAIVGIVAVILFSLTMLLFVKPLVTEVQHFIDDLPRLVQDAHDGKGAIGKVVRRYNLDKWIVDNQEKIRDAATKSTGSMVSVAGAVAGTVASALTILVMMVMMLLRFNSLAHAPLVFFKPEQRERVSRVAADAARSCTGYVAGNLFISLVAGTVTFTALTLLDVKYAFVIAVFVAFTDLIPMIGATLGAVPTILVAFVHSPKAGIIMLIVYVVYQQVENNFLQPPIMARTVSLSPLTVLISVLIGVDLAGMLGALLAIPVAGVIQVVGRDVLDNRGKLKDEPTIGNSETPVDELADDGTNAVK